MDIQEFYTPDELEAYSNSHSRSNKVIDYIEKKVRNRELRSGDRIPSEGQLSDLLGISRTAVREGIKQLEAQSILQVKQGARTCISSSDSISFDNPMLFKMLLDGVTPEEIKDFREEIELCVCMNAAKHISAEVITELREINCRMERIIEERPINYDEAFRLDYLFHKKLGDSCGNKVFASLYDFGMRLFLSMTLKSHKKGSPQPLDIACQNHDLLINAVEKDDLFDIIHAIKCTSTGWEYDVHFLGENIFAMDD